MSVNNEYPVLDGIAPSWADINVKISGEDLALIDMKDIAAINTSRTLEVGEQRGASGGRVLKHTTGSVSQEASWTLYRSGFQKLLEGLVVAAEAKGFVRGNEVMISLVHFNIQIQHTPFGDPKVYERWVKGCRIGGDALNSTEGTDADQVEVPLICKKIVDMINGKEVVLL